MLSLDAMRLGRQILQRSNECIGLDHAGPLHRNEKRKLRRALHLNGVFFRRNENLCCRLPRLLFALTPVSLRKLVMVAVEPRSADRASQRLDIAAESFRISN